MNEEEILKDISNYISFSNKAENFSDINEYLHSKELARRFQGLLDLYKAEKRKNKIKYEYLKLIVELGYDYDGCEKADSLKDLIDELVGLAVEAMENDDKTPIYNNLEGLTPKNILLEALDVKSNEFNEMCNKVRKEN